MITSHLQYKLCYWKRYLLVVVFADPGTKETNIYSRHQDGNPTTQLKLIPNTPSRESEHLLFVKRLSTVIVKQSRGHNNLINYQQCNKKPIKYRYCKLFMNFLYTFLNTNSKILKIIFHYHLTQLFTQRIWKYITIHKFKKSLLMCIINNDFLNLFISVYSG